MADIFISYSRADRPQCKAIAERLKREGYSIWFDSKIEPGTSFDREIEREIRAAAAVLVLWSPTSVESDWVRNEARMGKRANKLIALRIDECEPPLEFGSVQTVDMFGLSVADERENWTQVAARIAKLAEAPPVSAPAPIVAVSAAAGEAAPPPRRPIPGWLPWAAALTATLAAVLFALQPWQRSEAPAAATATPDVAAASIEPAATNKSGAPSSTTPAATASTTTAATTATPSSPRCRMVAEQAMVDKPVEVTKYRTESVTTPVHTPVRLNAGYHAESYSYYSSTAERIEARNGECERQVWHTAWPGSGWGKKCEGGQMQDERAECKCTATSCSVSLYGTCVQQSQTQRSVPYTETETRRVAETRQVEVCD